MNQFTIYTGRDIQEYSSFKIPVNMRIILMKRRKEDQGLFQQILTVLNLLSHNLTVQLHLQTQQSILLAESAIIFKRRQLFVLSKWNHFARLVSDRKRIEFKEQIIIEHLHQQHKKLTQIKRTLDS